MRLCIAIMCLFSMITVCGPTDNAVVLRKGIEITPNDVKHLYLFLHYIASVDSPAIHYLDLYFKGDAITPVMNSYIQSSKKYFPEWMDFTNLTDVQREVLLACIVHDQKNPWLWQIKMPQFSKD